MHSHDTGNSIRQLQSTSGMTSETNPNFRRAQNNSHKMQALQIYQDLRNRGIKPSIPLVLAALKLCSISRDLHAGKQIHLDVAATRDDSNLFVANSLVAMYAKCGSLLEARRLFDRMQNHDVVSWNTIILGYAENGDSEQALRLFKRMQDEGACAANRVSFLAAVKACSRLSADLDDGKTHLKEGRSECLEKGREVHLEAVKRGYESDIFVASSLVDMYAKFGSMEDARCVFDKMKKCDTVTWNAVLLGYSEAGEEELCFRMISGMQDEGCVPDTVTFIALLKACSGLAAKETGRSIDGKLLKFQSLEKVFAIAASCGCAMMNTSLANTLVATYGNCGSLFDAKQVFDNIPHRTAVSWNALVLAYAENGQGKSALELFSRMQSADRFAANRVTYLAALKACGSSAADEQGEELLDGKVVKLVCLEQGMAIHSQAVRSNCSSDRFVANALISMYSQCQSLEDAQRVFDRMQNRDVASWSALILGYAENGEAEVALQIFSLMQERGWAVDRVTFLAALKGCSSLVVRAEGRHVEAKAVKLWCLEKCRLIHSEAAKRGLDEDVFVASSLVDLYSKCGRMEFARRVFDKVGRKRNLVLWNAMILGYADNGEGESALQLFSLMRSNALAADSRTYVAALKACASEDGGVLEKGRALHAEVASSGLEAEKFVASALVEMYVKCGSLEEARSVFDRMKKRDAVLWTGMIQGYVESGDGSSALEVYRRMREEGCVTPDGVTYMAVLKACGILAAVEVGREIESEICGGGLDSDPVLVNCLVDFYGKCGCMVDARRVFERVGTKDLVTWNALIAGYSRQGDSKQVLEVFERMKKAKLLRPDGVTYLSVLTVCSHSGMVDEGKGYFDTMVKDEKLIPGIEHYCCMVDLLGRANYIEEAVEMVRSVEEAKLVNGRIWMAVLGACVKWKNVVIGRVAFDAVVRLDGKKASAYVLMANLYASVGMWEEHAATMNNKENV